MEAQKPEQEIELQIELHPKVTERWKTRRTATALLPLAVKVPSLHSEAITVINIRSFYCSPSLANIMLALSHIQLYHRQ